MIEDNLDEMYNHYLSKKKRRPAELAEEALKKSRKAKRVNLKASDESDIENASDADEPEQGESLLRREKDETNSSQRTKMWFAQDLFKGVGIDEDDDAAEQLELERMLAERAKKRKLSSNGDSANAGDVSKVKASEKAAPAKKVRFDADDIDTESDEDGGAAWSDDEAPQYAEEGSDGEEADLEDAFIDDDMSLEEKARMMALAKKMVGSSAGRSEIARSVYNKYPYTLFTFFYFFIYLFGDEDSTLIYALTLHPKRSTWSRDFCLSRLFPTSSFPPAIPNSLILSFFTFAFSDRPEGLEWFNQNEAMHSQPNIPITKEEFAAEREKLKAIDSRSTKRVLEAKARKKKHMINQLEKARQKAASVYDNEDMSNKSKTMELEKIYAKAHRKAKLQKVYVVGRKNKRTGPSGEGTRTRHVDSRMKKDKMLERARKYRKRKR